MKINKKAGIERYKAGVKSKNESEITPGQGSVVGCGLRVS
jgi:hypothetical protein